MQNNQVLTPIPPVINTIWYHPIQHEVAYHPNTFQYAFVKECVPNQEPQFHKTEHALMLSVICKYWKQVNEYYSRTPTESVTTIPTV